MKKAKLQNTPQGLVPHRRTNTRLHGHNKEVELAASRRSPETPTHPALNYWAINRKLEKLEQNYKRDQEKKPAEIEFSTVGNPRAAAVVWRVERLKQYVEEIKTAYETEIEAGRFADSPDLWAAVYAQKIVPSATANISSLLWHLGHKLWLTNGGGPGERASIAEAQRELSRLMARLESEMASACSHVKEAKAAEKSREASVRLATDVAQARTNKLKSPLKKAVYAYLVHNPEASDKEVLVSLQMNNPKVVPAHWGNVDSESLPGKTFTKVRKLLRQPPTPGMVSTATSRH